MILTAVVRNQHFSKRPRAGQSRSSLFPCLTRSVMNMQNIHLTPDNAEDDLYSGYEYSTIADELEDDLEFQRIIRTGYAQRPHMIAGGVPINTSIGARPPGTGLRTGAGRPVTGVAPESGQARPMTGVTAAGFSSVVKGQQFDPMSRSTGIKSSGATLEKTEDKPQEVIKKLEKNVIRLVEESAQAAAMGDLQTAVDKAKESARKERMLCKQRQQSQMTETINLDLTYFVLFNLGSQYHATKSYAEALNTYLLIVKNKMFSTGGRLRVNMGNIYVEQGKYPQAIKMYRMALDQIGEVHKGVRLSIMKNIGLVFVRMGQYADAITSFEHIMEEKADFRTALNLILCYYAISDRDKLKKTFHRMLQVTTGIHDEDRYYPTVEDDQHQRLLIEAIKDDPLRRIEKEYKTRAEHTILTAAKLIAPVIEGSFAVGFDWCIERVKESPYSELASELEITKALTFLKQKDIPKAIETFKDCGKKDNKMASMASTNLSFILFLENDQQQADKYAEVAMGKDRYNPQALVNKGCCVFARGDYDKGKEYFQEALNVEATCTEALYNLGLAYKKMNKYPDALDCFLKLHSILKNSAHVLYQLADLYDKTDDFDQAMEMLMQLVSLVPTDPRVLQRLGEFYDSDNDRSQAFQYYYESFRYCPTNIDVISWLGAYYMDSHFADKAIVFFEKAALIQPTQINWQLMVASCYRKTGNYQQALQCYKQIHHRFPESVDCLKFLVRLCTDLGLKEAQEYSLKLRKAEKALEAKKQREESGGSQRSNDSSRGRSSKLRPPPAKERILSGESVDSGSGSNRGSARERRKVDTSYDDPLGELPERPKTAARKQAVDDDEFNDVELGNDLLPE